MSSPERKFAHTNPDGTKVQLLYKGDDTTFGLDVTLGERGYFGSGVTVGDGATIGEGVQLESGVVIGSGAVIGYGVGIGANVVVGDGANIGRGSIILPGGKDKDGKKELEVKAGEQIPERTWPKSK